MFKLFFFPFLAENTCFDASQYAFFGNELEEFELGGLGDANEGDGAAGFCGPYDEESCFSSVGNREEVSLAA